CIGLSIATLTLTAGTYHGKLLLHHTAGATAPDAPYFFKFAVTGKVDSTTAASNATGTFGGGPGSLSATVTSAGGTANEGTATFTIKSGSTTIGSPVTSPTVSSGSAS